MLVNLILVLLSGVSLYAQSESSRQQRITAKYQNKTILEVLEDLKTKTEQLLFLLVFPIGRLLKVISVN